MSRPPFSHRCGPILFSILTLIEITLSHEKRYCLLMVVARSFFNKAVSVHVLPFGFYNAPWSDQCSRCHFHSGEPFDSLSSRTLTLSVLLSGLCVSRGRRIQCDWVRVYYILPQQQPEVEWNNKGTFLAVTQIMLVTENSHVIFLETVWSERLHRKVRSVQFLR